LDKFTKLLCRTVYSDTKSYEEIIVYWQSRKEVTNKSSAKKIEICKDSGF